ncbi:MAG TPA: hypothetical protein VLB75_13030 [Steroidobacteraceae bacterium]|nr:hypothetical protein [Steroidobacteraceae bacterium]
MKLVAALVLFPARLLLAVALLISLVAVSMCATLQDHHHSRLPS